jgi:hypothetical protein
MKPIVEDSYLMALDPPATPAQRARKRGLIARWTAIAQAWRGNLDAPEDVVVPSPTETLSTVGQARVLFPYVSELFALSADYIQAVRQIRVLVEDNPVFKAIDRKIAWSVGRAPTTIKLEKETRAGNKARRILEAMLERVKFDEQKPDLAAKMLREGGTSLEVIMSSAREMIDRVEYRPHDSIRPLKNKQNRFVNPNRAFQQVDAAGGVIAEFALWQLVDVNLEESLQHNRGIPHLQAARLQLEHSNTMGRGLVQKWIREAGSIEHFNIKNARRWPEVMRFKKENEAALEASPDNLVRQLFTMGETEVKRITADSSSFDTDSIEFVIDLIFLLAGTPKELFGFRFKSGAMREMIKLLTDHHNQTLDHVETRLFLAARKVCNWELLAHGINPEYVPYELCGGEFKPTRQVRIQKETIEMGAASVNDLRRASNLPPYPHPAFEIPGLYITPAMARALAADKGIELPELETEDQPEEVERPHAVPPGVAPVAPAPAPPPQRNGTVARNGTGARNGVSR